MIKLQEKEIEKLSAITGTTPLQATKLIAMGILNESRCLDALLVYDYRRLKRRSITNAHIVQGLKISQCHHPG